MYHGLLRLYYNNTLIQELGSTKTYKRISTDARSIVNTHSIDITANFAVSIKEKQDRLGVWEGLRFVIVALPGLFSYLFFVRYIGYRNFINDLIKHVSLLILVHVRLLFCLKLLTSYLTAVKKHWIRYYDTVYERDGINYFCQLKIPMMFSINLNLITFRPLNCLYMIFLHCIQRYLIIL